MTDSPNGYRRVPGRRRGFIFSASLWSGADHLLSVKSARFQEHYKRFYFRDIQAIVVTRVPRFLVSPALALCGSALLLALLILRRSAPLAAEGLSLLLIAGAAAWLYVSLAQSCVCRLFTAVSREDLPSIYRMWTARKALAELESRIAAVQGVFTENWAAAADARVLGPPETAAPGTPGQRLGPARSRTWISDLFLASLLADSVVTLVLMRSYSPALANLSLLLTLVQIVAAAGIFIQRYQGALRSAMQTLAIVALIFIGAVTYGQMVGDAVEQALAGRHGTVVKPRERSGIVRPIYSGGAALLALAGFVLSFKPE